MGAFRFTVIFLSFISHSLFADTNKVVLDRQTVDYGKTTAINISGKRLGNLNLVLSPRIPSIDYSKYFLSPITHISYLDQYVIVADQQTLHITKPQDDEVKIISRLELPQAIQSITSNGQKLFLLGKNNTITVYAEKNEKLVRQKVIKSKSPILHLFATPNRLYLIKETSPMSLQVIKLSGKDAFRGSVKFTLTADRVNKIYAQGRYVYLAKDSGLQIINAHRLDSIKPHAYFHSSSRVLDVVAHHDSIYIAEDGVGLTRLQLKDNELLWRSSLNRNGRINKILHNGQHIFIASNRSTISRISSEDGRLNIASQYYSPKPFRHIYAFKNHLLIANDKTLEWIRFDKSTFPSNVNQMANYGGSRKVFIKDNHAYVADWFSGLHIYDISTEHFPKLVSSFPTKGSPKGVVVHENYAFVADDDHGLLVVNVQNPKQPKLLKALDTPGLAYTMVIAYPFLYLADHHAGIHIIDIKKPEEPWIVGSFDTPGKAWSIAVKDQYAFVADDTTGLMVFDIANPQQLKKVSTYHTGRAAEDVVIKGNTAFVSFFDDGMHIVDISNPRKLKLVKAIKTHGNARGVLISHDKAYISDWHAGVHIVDVKNPLKANTIGYFDTPGSVWGLGIQGDIIVAMDWWGGISVLKEKQRQLELIGSYHGRGEPHDLVLRDGFAFVAHGSGGVQVFDTRTALNPIWITGYETGGQAKSIFIEGNRAYVTNGDKSVHILDISNPFSVKKVAEVTLEDPVEQIVTKQEIAFIRNQGKGWCIVDLKEPEKARKIQTFDSQINELLIRQNVLYVIDSKRIRSYDIRTPNKPAIKAVWSIPNIVSADIKDNLLAAGIKNRGIAVYQLEQFESKQLSRLATRSDIKQLRLLDGHTIIAGTVHGEVMEFSYVPTKGIQLRNINPSLTPFNNFDLYKQTVYLTTPSNSLTSLQLLPKLEIHATENELKAIFPADMPMGDYQLLLYDPFTGERQTLANSIKVGLGKAKSDFSLKDLEKAMKKLKIVH